MVDTVRIRRASIGSANVLFKLNTQAKLGRVDELFDANPHGNEMYQSQKGLAQLLIPRGNTSKVCEIVAEPFSLLTELVEVCILV